MNPQTNRTQHVGRLLHFRAHEELVTEIELGLQCRIRTLRRGDLRFLDERFRLIADQQNVLKRCGIQPAISYKSLSLRESMSFLLYALLRSIFKRELRNSSYLAASVGRAAAPLFCGFSAFVDIAKLKSIAFVPSFLMRESQRNLNARRVIITKLIER